MRLPAALRPDPDAPLTQAWLAALWMGLLANWPLWQRLGALEEISGARGAYFLACFAGFVIAITGALLSLVSWPRLARPVLTLLLLAAAALAYFIGSYGIVFDPDMAVNTLQTDLRETRDLLSWRLAASLLALGALPAWWLWRRPAAAPQPLLRRLGRHLAGFALGLAVAVGLALACFADLSSTMRNHKELRYMITPLNGVYSFAWAATHRSVAPAGPPAVVGADAHLLPRATDAKPPLLLLVIGETARAANFSLNGYARPTNPELGRLPVLSFAEVSSCGTATASSLPCMFAPWGRAGMEAHRGPQENLLDVLQRAGLAVLWIDNQSGCKGLCDRVPHAATSALPHEAEPLPQGLCQRDEVGQPECFDDALLHGLDQRLAALEPARLARGVVLVLHQMGSHGPAYFKRSPEAFKHFLPECRSNALQQCPREQVVNAYDNTLVTTDHLLAGSIAWLRTQREHYDAGLLYVSDHGESLGENGLYLHGLPYAIAPREQTQVPMVWWLPEDGTLARGLKPGCLDTKRSQPASHDQLFHTVMGWVGARADVYRAELDLLAGCRS